MSRVLTSLRHLVAEINYADRRLFELRTRLPGERPSDGRSNAL